MGSFLNFQKDRRVVFIVESPFSQRDRERFGISHFEARGFIPEVWNVGPLTLPGAQNQVTTRATRLKVRNIFDWAELRLLIESLDDGDSVISVVGVQRGQMKRCRGVHRALRRGSFCYATFLATPTILWDGGVKLPPLKRIKHYIFSWSLSSSKLPRKLLALRRSICRLRCLDYAWVATDVEDLDPIWIDGNTKIVFIHSLDYDFVIEAGVASDFGEGPPILVDDMGPDHPDFVALEETRVGPLNSREYFRRLCLALDALEQRVGEEIEIAAHPRAGPGSLESKYGNRRVHYGDTFAQIQRASLVLLTGASTATGMAVALNKPLIMVWAEGIHVSERTRNDELVSRLTLPVWKSNQFQGRQDWESIDKYRYALHMESFVKRQGTVDLPFWTVVAKCLQSR